MDNSLFLKSGTFITKKYNRILFASIGGWLVALIDSCADSVLAGIFLDDTAVSAISLVQPITSVIAFLAYLVSVGTSILFSRECGAFRREKGYKLVGQGIICSGIISVVLVVTMLLIRNPLMAFYGAGEEITAMAKDYYMCEVFFAAVYPIYYLIYQLVVLDGDDLFAFLACFASMSANLISSILLVGSLGVKGLAIGTIIGTITGFIVYCFHFLRKTNSVHAKLYFNLHDLWETIKISSSTSMALLYIAFIDIVFNKFIISAYGEDYLAAYAVVNFMLNLGAVFVGLYDACSGFVSVAYGENNPHGIRKTMKVAYKALIISSLVAMVILELISPYIPDLYGITDASVRSVAVFAARIISLTCPALAIYNLFCTYYSAVGRVWLGHLISIVYMLISPLAIALPLGLIFGFNGMSVGFALTSIVAEAVTAIIIIIKYGKKAFPLALDETNEEFISYEIKLTPEGIMALCDAVHDELTARQFPIEIVTEALLIIEEGYLCIMEKNRGKKVLTQCDLLISDKSLRLITRDNGIIFNITDDNARVKDLRGYVVARIMEHNTERTNTTTISFNRNSYVWKISE